MYLIFTLEDNKKGQIIATCANCGKIITENITKEDFDSIGFRI